MIHLIVHRHNFFAAPALHVASHQCIISPRIISSAPSLMRVRSTRAFTRWMTQYPQPRIAQFHCRWSPSFPIVLMRDKQKNPPAPISIGRHKLNMQRQNLHHAVVYLNLATH